MLEELEDDEDRRESIKRIIDKGFIKPQHGDGLIWKDDGYRNENLMFWNAETQEVIYPYTEIDDYGSVPPCFKVGNEVNEFSPTYWIDIVDHNSIVFLSETLEEELIKKLTTVEEKISTQIYSNFSKIKYKIYTYKEIPVLIKNINFTLITYNYSKIDYVTVDHDNYLIKS
jgi:hypothetical protein